MSAPRSFPIGGRLPAPRDWARVNRAMHAVLLQDHAGIDAETFAQRLRERGIDTRPFFTGLHEQPALRARGLFVGLRLPVTESMPW